MTEFEIGDEVHSPLYNITGTVVFILPCKIEGCNKESLYIQRKDSEMIVPWHSAFFDKVTND